MALTVLAITPEDLNNSVTIDSKVVIEFNGSVDPFTLANGISVYAETENLWSGPDLAALDTKYRDVLLIGQDYSYYPFTYSVDGNTVTLNLQVSMIPDKTHYVSVLPGDDATRYVSSPTTGAPVYNKIDPLLSGTVDIVSQFTGPSTGAYTLTFTDTNKVDVILDADYLGEFIYINGEELNLGALKVSISGNWTINDTVSIPVYKASGVDVVYKSKFITTKYTVTTPTSIRIEDKLKAQSIAKSLKVIGTIPQGLSVNNSKCNPIVIKFSAPIDATQDFTSKIRISKTSLVTGQIKAVSYFVKATGDTIKIYLVAINNSGTVDQTINLDDVVQQDIRKKMIILE